jgi:diguanylate cyclase (GGDEF)-like protein/PAS domain S-box-containing protein
MMGSASLKVLIVDDSREDVETFRRLLGNDPQQDYRVLAAGEGAAGLAAAGAERPDCIVLDFGLPDMDGLEFITALDAASPDGRPAIVIVTGQGSEHIAVNVMKAGAHDYVVKGEVTSAILKQAIRHAISQKAALDRLQESEGKFRAITECTTDLTYILGDDLVFAYASPSVCRFTGFESELILGRELDMLVHPGDAKTVREAVLRARAEPGTSVTVEDHRVHNPNRGWIYFSGRATAMPWVPGVNGIVVHCQDVTERRWQEEIIRRQANFDALTGLPNRTLFRDRLSRALSSAIRNGTRAALLFVDIDAFKNVNDTLGHTAGDELLKEAASRLAACVREVDTVARLGGDEFTLVLPDIHEPIDAELVARKVLAALAEPFALDSTKAFVSASVGVTLYPDDAEDEENLLRNADTAMYRAKEEGRNRLRFFTARMHTEAMDRLHLDVDLRDALERGEFLLHYQPIVDLASGFPTGFEALLRWRHPARGLVPPGQFIPRAEQTGLIVPVGTWVLEAACRQLKSWQEAGYSRLRMSVNVSARQCREPAFEATVRRILESTGVGAGSVVLEITESLFIDDSRGDAAEAAAVFRRLRDMGIRVALDDFGTGYSSLSYLKRFPVDILKIDRSFVQDIAANAEDKTLVDAIIAMAHGLGIAVVAEGMETEQQTRILSSRRCDGGQGYFFGKPAPAEQAAAEIERARAWLAGDGAQAYSTRGMSSVGAQIDA